MRVMVLVKATPYSEKTFSVTAHMDTLVQWRGFGNAGIQLFKDAAKAGRGIMTIVVPDMAAVKTLLHDQGIEIERIQEGGFGKTSHVADPDGNVITLAEPPKGN